jgi:hypothetical protein
MANDDHIDDPAQSGDLREQAERCRRLSRATYDRATSEMLDKMAQNFDRGAAAANED